MSQTPHTKVEIQRYANHMWKGFSEIEIFWVKLQFQKEKT